MNIKNFKYGFRFTDEKYSLFSNDELSNIDIINEEKIKEFWNNNCDNEIIEKCSFIDKLVSKKLEVVISDCGWGNYELELNTTSILNNIITSDTINIYYDYNSALKVNKNLFCNKWSDFCYPSDVLLIESNNSILLYYEDTIYRIELLK